MKDKNKYKFAFLVHSREYTDVYKKFPIAKILPRKIIELWCFYWPPIVVTSIRHKYQTGNISGLIIAIPMTAQQMLNNKQVALKRIKSAIKKAKKLNINFIGLGALTSSVTKGGILVKDDNLNITTGNSLTAAVSVEHIKEIVRKNKIDTIAVVGGTGSIGQGIVNSITNILKDKEYLIFARTEANLITLIENVKKNNSNISIKGYIKNMTELRKADLVVVATSSSEAIIKSEHLKEGAVVYDVTQPQNIDKTTMSERKDLKIIDGGLVYSENIYFNFSFGLPRNVIFSCLGETILLATENQKKNFLGKTNVENIKLVKKISSKYDFKFYLAEHKL